MHALSTRNQGLIAINIAAVIFGTAAMFGKLDISPFWIVAMRGLFAAIALLFLGVVKQDLSLPARKWWHTIVITGVILATHWLTFFASVQMAGIAIATLTFAAFPFFTVLIETSHQKRKPVMAEIMAALAIVIAVGMLVNPQNAGGNAAGTVLGLVSALTFAWFGHASKQLGRTLTPLNISLAQNIVVFLALTPMLFIAQPAPALTSDWLWLVLLGVFTTAFMHQLYFYALNRLSASTCSGFVALEPVYAILFAALFLDEPVTLWVIVSGILIVGASCALLKCETHT